MRDRTSPSSAASCTPSPSRAPAIGSPDARAPPGVTSRPPHHRLAGHRCDWIQYLASDRQRCKKVLPLGILGLSRAFDAVRIDEKLCAKTIEVNGD